MAINFNHAGAGIIVLSSDAATTLKIDGYKLWHENNDGASSTLDADKLDGQEGSWYQDAANLNAGTIPDARIQASGVTQHEASITVAESQITDGSLLARVGGSEAITGSWTFNTTLPTSSVTPSNASDLVTKAYVDNLSTGLNAKASVKCATTADITLSGEQTLDGILTSASRVLVKNQTAPAENGIYVSAAGAWARALDNDTWVEMVSAYVFVEEGTAHGDQGWLCTNDAGGTLDTTSITWVQFNTGTAYLGGAGMTLDGSTFNVGTASTARIVVNADDIDLATTTVSANSYGSASSVATFTVDAYGRLTTASSTAIEIAESAVTDGAILARVGSTETITGAWTFNTTAPAITVNNTMIGSGAATDSKQALSIAQGQFAAAGDASARMYVIRRSTSDATPAVLTIDGGAPTGSNTLVMGNDSTWFFNVYVVARRTDTDDESAAYQFSGAIDRNANAGSTSIVGSVMESVFAEDTTAWSASVTAETTNGSLQVAVTGEAGKTIRWVAYAEITQVAG